MNISYNWLREYIDHGLTPEELSAALTGIGLEVEAFEPTGGLPDLDGFVTGRVLTCEKHPDADRLSLTTVDTGTGHPLDIVCGAPNVKAGQAVIIALPGANVTIGDKSFVIKKTKIRVLILKE
jgi:phenylalanyl-tRNA synthetase beta chain